MLYRALSGLPPGSVTPKPQTGPVRKTHGHRPEAFAGARAGVFVFGDPVAAVFSTRLHRWDRGHFRNCGVPDLDPATADVFRADVLGYERMFDAWMGPQPFDLVAVRYERLHANADLVASVLGTAFELPPFRPRRRHDARMDPADRAAAARTYARLAGKVAAAPDVAVWRARPGRADVPSSPGP